MASLLQKLGMPPYQMDQIVSLLDEASALCLNTKTTSAQHHDDAVQIAEATEALASLLNTSLATILPQFVVKPDTAAVKRQGPYIVDVDIPPSERDVLDSLGPRTLELKDWLFNNIQQSSQTSRSALGTAQLCQNCSWPFKRIARRPNETGPLPDLFSTPHYLLTIDDWPNFHVLEKRALQGCDLCRFLREHLRSLAERRPGTFDAEPVHVWIGFLCDRPWTSSSFLESVMVFLTSRRSFIRALYFTIDTIHDSVTKELGICASPSILSLGSTNVDFIKRQLVSTEKNVATPNRYRPKRLLDLGFSTQFEPKVIHGQQAEVTPDGLRYAALSYCWGEDSKNQLKLTADTEQKFYRAIPFGSLTPVLRDAITVCRILEVRYLWIDSLCIQQDGDSTDWEEQSQEMSHIFGNSWLTICASASGSCIEGFLDHTDRHSPTVEIQHVSEESGQVHGSFFLRLFTHNGEPALRDGALMSTRAALFRDLKYSKWHTRGWVFQERILSPRLLYFGARMVHFQHGNHVSSEDGTFFHGDFIDPTYSVMRPCPTNLLQQLEMIHLKGPFITDFWYSLVTTFNPSNFTDRRDTFPAIAGIARRVHEFTGQRYVVGLWEEDLCCGLVWTPQLKYQGPPASLRQVLQIIKKSTNTIAPSWSWASRRSSITFIVTDPRSVVCRVRRHLRAESKILESHVTVNGVNPYGRIENASISLSGRTMRLAQDSLGLMQMVDPQVHLCELSPGLFIFVHSDWAPKNYWEHTGIKKQMRGYFQLLLMASCCSDGRISLHNRAAHGPPLAAHAEPAPGLAHHPRPSVRPGTTRTRQEMADMYNKEALRPEYRTTFNHDSHPGFDAAVDCDLCSDQTLRRDIWGLLIYPAGPKDTYYRVGVFFSRAEHGGSAIFEGVEPRRIELV